MSDEVLEVPDDRPAGSRRAEVSSRFPVRLRLGSARGGARARRTRRRAKSLGSTIGLTTLGAVVPGSGYLVAGRRWLGAVVLVGWLATIGALAWYFGRGVDNALDFVFNPTLVRVAAVGLGLGLLVWAFVVVTSHRLLRPRERPRSHTIIGNVLVGVLVLAGAAPVVRAAQYAMVTADGVDQVFGENVKSATAPTGITADDPWAGQDRVNILLLGGDGGEGRTGVRTDTVILASVETKTGKTTMFSLPRNMMYAEFPEDSPLHDIYPDGYQTGQGDPGFDMLNAIYSQVPELHPGILGESDNEGADAVKQAVEGSLGIPVDYYLLVNLKGFQTVVDALGGITVNINEKVAINGDTSAGIPPTGYLEPGPDQHLDGFHALWFARGRYGSDDYERMDRQRCAIDAIIEAADPSALFTRYIDIVKAGKEIVYTDIPRKIAQDFVSLLLRVKDGKIRSVVFRSSDKFFSGDPDYDYVRETVQNALYPPKRKKGAPRVRRAEDPVDVCAYNPESDDSEDEVSASD
ncbi:LCP family protein [Nocardioides sp.]|uniref:LCP family protein n=1 Tax=Nocardioides sp. TaxID=35761 RepID=UPI00271E3BBD|nr:LCP family protein [Nocardioides sp.]MDO9454874.1 LCP family protein [Nocardioides sp.]